MDTAGKDGIIRRVFEGVNPEGVRVASFKVPTPPEADHDYLWRIHAQVPAKGEMVIFNRSHYEQVLVVRVHSLEPTEAWRAHYQQICDFERMMVEEGATILKFFLNITKDEQKKRLLERIDMPEKRWKFSSADLSERKLWDQYMQAYQEPQLVPRPGGSLCTGKMPARVGYALSRACPRRRAVPRRAFS
jgi:PPK2 family polyphosphate:nucleotide phosphotransferase